MKIGSLVRQKIFDIDTRDEPVFRYGILYKVPGDGVMNLGFGWVFWQLDKDGPYAVSNESYCEAVQLKDMELVAHPNTGDV
tara:strand:+ start:612 stop:854 length:243 start_codon:yes stop_codon:yes gene_type:complete